MCQDPKSTIQKGNWKSDIPSGTMKILLGGLRRNSSGRDNHMWKPTDKKICTIIKTERGLEKLEELYEIHLGNRVRFCWLLFKTRAKPEEGKMEEYKGFWAITRNVSLLLRPTI